jgi:hypothetical protein
MRHWFSNFVLFDTPMLYDGDLYTTPEAFYQAMKTLDKSKRSEIAKMSPNQAKKAGKKLLLRNDWNSVKEQVMLYAQRYRFRKNTIMRERLLLTGNSIIEETNTWHDNYWGICMCSVVNGNFGNRNCSGGKNLLGKLIMQVRDEIRKET